MDVEVLGDTCAGGAALVDADVDALGEECALHEVCGELGEHPELGALRGGVVQEGGSGFAEGDEEVAVGVGVLVEEDEAAGGAEEDVVFAVAVGGEPVVEEEGAGGRSGVVCGCAFGGVERFEVRQAPGGGEGGCCAGLGVGRLVRRGLAGGAHA